MKNLSYRLLFSIAVLSITLLLTGLGCGRDGNDEDDLMCGGTNRCMCYGNTDCDYACEGTDACGVVCNGAPSCDVACGSTELCQVSCETSARCNVDCAGGECIILCPASGCTVTNCADPEKCRVGCGDDYEPPSRSGSTATCR